MKIIRHSKVDVITNSSTELYVMANGDIDEVREAILVALEQWMQTQLKENPKWAKWRGLDTTTPEEFMKESMTIEYDVPEDVIERYGFEDYYNGSSDTHICVEGTGDNSIPWDLMDTFDYIARYHFG